MEAAYEIVKGEDYYDKMGTGEQIQFLKHITLNMRSEQLE